MSKKKKTIISIIAVTIILLGIIGANLGKFLVKSDKLEKADAIVVFSGDNGPIILLLLLLLK